MESVDNYPLLRQNSEIFDFETLKTVENSVEKVEKGFCKGISDGGKYIMQNFEMPNVS